MTSEDQVSSSASHLNGFAPPPRSSTPSSLSSRRRDHSDSISSRHSVHFDDQVATQHITKNPTNHQPQHPSALHNATIPSSPQPANIVPLTPSLSPKPKDSPSYKPFPTSPLSNGHGNNNESYSPPRASSGLPNRRVLSEALHTSDRANRTGSVIANGKRPSRVTGGYETSSDEHSTTEQTANDADIGTPGTPGTPSFFTGAVSGLPANAVAGPSRQRAKSLLSTVNDSLRPDWSSRELRLAPRRRSSKDPVEPKSAGVPSSRFSQTNSRPLPTSVSDSFFHRSRPDGSPDRVSTKRQLDAGNVPEPSRVTSIRTTNTERSRVDGENNRKGKGKEKDNVAKVDNLAASLGLGGDGPRDVALSPEQLQSLFNDSDIASALRILQNPHMTSPRPPLLSDPSRPNVFSAHPSPSITPAQPHRSPYLVSAPPALINDDETQRRERTVSVSSSVISPAHSTWASRERSNSDAPSEIFGLGRRKSMSRGGQTSDGQGGHIPFTHHVPVVQIDEEDTDEDVDRLSREVFPGIGNGGPSPSAIESPSGVSSKKDRPEKRSRLSKVFHLGRRRSSDTTVSEATLKEHQHDKKKKEDQVREKAQYERDAEMRKREQQRRDEELAQERRFRALTQVAAHPAAERAAYRTGAHLRALYQHVYEGIDDPPKLNPLAVLRWRKKTDEQNDARRRWEAEHGEAENGNAKPANSPANRPEWGGVKHASPMSAGSSSKISAARESVESGASGSLYRRARENSPRKRRDRLDVNAPAKGWHYTVETIAAYKDCDGVVNYFIPPRRSYPDVEVMSDTEQRRDNRNRQDDASSVGDSSKGAESARPRVTSASNASIGEFSGARSADGSAAGLSRSASIETGGKGTSFTAKDHRLTHRTHQSLGAIGPTAIGHALKQPFEKISNAARKQRIMPTLGFGATDAEVEHDEMPNGHGHLSPIASNFTRQPNNSKLHTPVMAKASRTSVNSTGQRQRENNFFRRHAAQETLTDEEGGRDFHLRKLFLKGQKVFALDDARASKRSELGKPAERVGLESREAELLALESALARESAFRESQAEASRKTRLEIEAQDRIRRLEEEIYAERSKRLETARQKLDTYTGDIDLVDESIRQYLAQIDFVDKEARVGAEIEVDWSLADPLRGKYAPDLRSIEDGYAEHRDILPPLKNLTSFESGSDIPRRQNSSGSGVVRGRGRSGAPASQEKDGGIQQPRPKRSLSISVPPIIHQFAVTMRHRPRRTYLDPSGTTRVDPVKQAELMIDYAREKQRDLGKDKEDLGVELQKMIKNIEAMMRQKEVVRHWARDTLERNTARQTTLDQLLAQEKSSGYNDLRQQRDLMVNTIATSIFWVYRTGYWFYLQGKSEIGLYLKPFRPSTYCRSSSSSISTTTTTSREYMGNGNGNGKISNTGGNVVTKTYPYPYGRYGYGNGQRRRVPVLGLLSVGVVAVAIFFYVYGS